MHDVNSFTNSQIGIVRSFNLYQNKREDIAEMLQNNQDEANKLIEQSIQDSDYTFIL